MAIVGIGSVEKWKKSSEFQKEFSKENKYTRVVYGAFLWRALWYAEFILFVFF